MGNVTTVIEYTQHSLAMGQLVHPVSAPTLMGLGILGSIIKQAVNTGKRDPNTHLIMELGNKMDRMSLQMDNSYRDLKHLIVENQFRTNIVVEAAVIDRLMKNLLKYRTRATLNEFNNQFRKMDPHGLAVRMLEWMRHQSTDPVYAAMNADPLWSRHTYKTWQRSLHNMLGTLLIAHSFHAGLEGNQKSENQMSEPATMIDVVNEILQEFGRFHDKYDGGYWPHRVRQLVERTADNNQHLWNDAKAVILRDALNSIYTRAEFYIIVYDACSGNGRHWIIGDYVHQFRRGGCNIVIGRSRGIAYSSHEQRARLHEQVESWRDGYIHRDPSSGFQDSARRVSNHVENNGFVAIIADECNPQIRSAGHYEWGPGWWIGASASETVVSSGFINPYMHSRQHKRFPTHLIVGYR